jgi:hypothetical protein
MPNGERRFSRKTARVAALPSVPMPRSRVIRFALGVPAPARFMNCFISQPLTPLPSSGLGGAFVSATRTSPLGSTVSQRGWSRPVA